MNALPAPRGHPAVAALHCVGSADTAPFPASLARPAPDNLATARGAARRGAISTRRRAALVRNAASTADPHYGCRSVGRRTSPTPTPSIKPTAATRPAPPRDSKVSSRAGCGSTWPRGGRSHRRAAAAGTRGHRFPDQAGISPWGRTAARRPARNAVPMPPRDIQSCDQKHAFIGGPRHAPVAAPAMTSGASAAVHSALPRP